MEIFSLSLVVISALIHSTWNFFFKKSKDQVIFIFWAKIFQILIYFPIVIYLLSRFGLNEKGIPPIIGSGLVHFFYWLFISLAYKYGDLSLVYPVARSSPLLIALFSFLIFGEKITIFGFFGILLIIIGIFFISSGNFDFRNFLKIFNKENKGLIFALLCLIAITFHSLIDRVGAKYVNSIIYVYLFEIISLSLFAPYVLIIKKRRDILKILKDEKIKIFYTAISIILSYSIIIYVMNLSKLSYIVSVREIGVIFSVLLGTIFLKEKYGFIRFISSILIFSGIFLISVLG
ncbi:MAG: EamA family transporter [Caldisericia bacterium]|nr:EamA family transporter [Caldisericia bacterium]